MIIFEREIMVIGLGFVGGGGGLRKGGFGVCISDFWGFRFVISDWMSIHLYIIAHVAFIRRRWVLVESLFIGSEVVCSPNH